MRLCHSVVVVILTAVATIASATPDQGADRTVALASANLEKGGDLLAETSKLRTNAARLQTLDRALYFLKRARTLAVGGNSKLDTVRADASQSIVRALDDEAEIYYRRKSLWLARKRVDEAIEIDRGDPRARNLVVMIATAESTDVYSENVGAAAIDRIRQRRAAAGIPLRDRGIGNRR